MGVNIGHEQDGKNKYFERPVIILRKFNQNMFLALPLTSKNKTGKYFFPVFLTKGKKQQKSHAIISQIRLLDQKRLLRKMEKMENKEFQKLRKKVQKSLFQKGNSALSRERGVPSAFQRASGDSR